MLLEYSLTHDQDGGPFGTLRRTICNKIEVPEYMNAAHTYEVLVYVVKLQYRNIMAFSRRGMPRPEDSIAYVERLVTEYEDTLPHFIEHNGISEEVYKCALQLRTFIHGLETIIDMDLSDPGNIALNRAYADTVTEEDRRDLTQRMLDEAHSRYSYIRATQGGIPDPPADLNAAYEHYVNQQQQMRAMGVPAEFIAPSPRGVIGPGPLPETSDPVPSDPVPDWTSHPQGPLIPQPPLRNERVRVISRRTVGEA